MRAVVELAHALGLSAVAEGVETEAQYKGLCEIGCDLAQGWYFGVPAAAADVADPRARASWPQPGADRIGRSAPMAIDPAVPR